MTSLVNRRLKTLIKSQKTMAEKSTRIIIYNTTVYELTEEQYERLLEIKEEANNLPFAGDLHVEEHLNFNVDQYRSLGEIDLDFDEPYSL